MNIFVSYQLIKVWLWFRIPLTHLSPYVSFHSIIFIMLNIVVRGYSEPTPKSIDMIIVDNMWHGITKGTLCDMSARLI